MSFHSSKNSPEIVIHCDVCGEQITHTEDGHVNWNGDGPFTFNHYGCGSDIFHGRNYDLNMTLGDWIFRLLQGVPSKTPSTDPLDVSKEDWLAEKGEEWETAQYNERERIIFEKEQREYLAEVRKRFPLREAATHEKWTAMRADELLKKGEKK